MDRTGLDYPALLEALEDITEALVESKTIMFTKTLTKRLAKHAGTYYIKVHENEIKEILWAYNKLMEHKLTSEDFKIKARIDTLVSFNNRLTAELKLKEKTGSYYIFKAPTKIVGKLESVYVNVVFELDNSTAQLISKTHQDADKVVDFVRQAIVSSTNQALSLEPLPSNMFYSIPFQETSLNLQQPDNLPSLNALNPQFDDTVLFSQNKEGGRVKSNPSFRERVDRLIKEGKKVLKDKGMYVVFDDNTVVINITKAIEEFKKWSIRDFEYEITENGTVRAVRYTNWDEFVNDKNMPLSIEKSKRNILQRIRYVEIFLEHTKEEGITEETIEKFFDWLQYTKQVTNGKNKRIGVSKATFTKYKSHIKKFFEFLKLRDYQGYVGQINYNAKTKRSNKTEVIDEGDIKKLIRQITESNKFTSTEKDWLVGLILLEATTGLRISEALRLKVGDIDFENKIILVRSEITKKDYSRVVYVTEEVARYLRDIVAKYNKNPNDHLFSPDMPGFKEPSKGRITQRLKRAGINFKMKSLRKFYVTMTRNPPKKAFETLKTNKVLESLEFLTAGHKTLQIVESHYDYTQTSVEEILKKAKLLDRLLAKREVYDVIFKDIRFLE